jgi:hypothetical protein
MIDGSGAGPDPYLVLTDPDPEVPKTYGSGSAALFRSVQYKELLRKTFSFFTIFRVYFLLIGRVYGSKSSNQKVADLNKI